MKKTQKNIRHVFWIYTILFGLFVFSLGKYILFDASGIIINSYNPRLNNVNNNIKRGEIIDSNGNVLASSYKLGDAFLRDYPQAKKFAHVVGYMNRGKTGLEALYNFTLQSIDNEIIQRVNNIMSNEDIVANNIVLTLDNKLQEIAYEGLGSRKAAIVVMEPSTGKILAMVSSPAFDPNAIQADWSDLINNDNSPLINRALSGLYPPGSIFKLLTAAAAIESGHEDFVYDCKGTATFDDKVIHCFNNKAHGEIDLTQALTVSCNTYFAQLLDDMGVEYLQQICEKALFNTPYEITLPHSTSSFTANKDTTVSLLSQTAIGQGKTLVTPIHMAIITSAIANGGIAMEPYIVDSVVSPSGSQLEKNVPRSLTRIFSMEQADRLTTMMQSVVDKGTAKPLAINGIKIGAKTGTAENEGKLAHGWLVAFAPIDKPEIAVSIVLENSDGPAEAMPLVKKIINHWLNK